MGTEEKTNQDKVELPIIESLPPISDKERDKIKDAVAAVWFFFGRPRGDKFTDYFLPVELAFRIFKMNSRETRKEFFKELCSVEGITSNYLSQIKGGQDEQ